MRHGTTLFLSSTKVDLVEFRDVAIHVAQRLGIRILAMEDFGPDPRDAMALCQEKLRSADLFLGLYAHRYGFRAAGFEGASITQMEYEWAVAQGLPVLLFLVDDDQPWPPRKIDHGEDWESLQRFKALLRSKHVVAPLTTPEQLREDLFVHLPTFIAENSARERSTVSSAIPSPPEPYVAHPYTLLQTEDVVGRERELALLERWIGDPCGKLYASRVLCWVAIGGMGKSALTWKWFHSRGSKAKESLAGGLWWSFYESEADFGRFVTAALAYCTGRSPQTLAEQSSPLEREGELLRVLDQKPFLLVLDGFERLLIAYAGLDFAHLADDDLDRRTANAVVGALGLPEGSADAMIGQHRLRKTIDPRVGNFLRKLCRVQKSRILITTRLYPSELQTVTGAELPGSAAVFLRGLDPEAALALWRAMGVSGSDEELDKLFATFERYPLLIRALAGEVARFRRAPGDFDAWRRAHPDFDPFALPLVQVKSHVLAYALGNLEPDAKEVLHTIAAFRSPTDYGTLFDLYACAKGKQWSADKLDSLLTSLEDRGLLGWDRRNNRYDLHPIVRGIVWTGLDRATRQGVYGALRSYFEAIPDSASGLQTLADAKPAIELFNALVGLERFKEAVDLYFERIHPTDFDFAAEGALDLQVAMLESLFPEGFGNPPGSTSDSGVFSQLGHAYKQLGRLEDALTCYWKADSGGGVSGAMTLDHISEVELLLGNLRDALLHAKNSVAKTHDLFKYHESHLAVCEAAVGKVKEAENRLAKQRQDEFFSPEKYSSRVALWMGEDLLAVERSQVYLRERGQQYYLNWLSVTLVLAEAQVNLGRETQVADTLESLLREATARSLPEPELECRRVLAELYRRRGELDQAREILDDLWEPAIRGPYRLILADASIVLAKIERDAGHLGEAQRAAQEAYRYAYCDGPPYTYHWALQKATALLKDLGAIPAAPPPGSAAPA